MRQRSVSCRGLSNHNQKTLMEKNMKELENVKVSVILPASGSGERFGSNPPKQFCKLLDKPLLLHTISCFHSCSFISDIIIPVSLSFLQYTQELVVSHGFHKVTVISGCKHRHRSIYSGIKHLKEAQSRVVIIHDAVRVYAEENLIKEVALAALQHGASGVVRPLVSTVISADSDGHLCESLDRSKYRASEMPQGFLYSTINKAYEQATDYDFEFGTECLLLAKKYTGTNAKLIDGPDYLWKVTYKKDLNAAEELLKEKLLKVKVQSETCQGLKKAIVAKCEERNISVISGDSDLREDPICNTMVNVFENFDCKLISKYSDMAVKTNACENSLHIPRVIVHVYKGPKLDPEKTLEYMYLCRKLAENDEGTLVYGVISEDKGHPSDERLSTVIVDTLWNRTKSLSGQTFYIN